MDSKVKYQRLKDKKKKRRYIFSICFGSKNDTPEISPEEYMVELGNRIKQLEMNCRFMDYKRRSTTDEAKFCLKKGDKLGAKVSLEDYKLNEINREKSLRLCVRLRRVRDEIERIARITSVAKNMDVANKILDKAMSEFSIEQIDDIMVNIDTNVEKMNDVNTALGSGFDEIDVDFELQALEKEIAYEIEIQLPSVPAKEKEEEEEIKNRKIKITEL